MGEGEGEGLTLPRRTVHTAWRRNLTPSYLVDIAVIISTLVVASMLSVFVNPRCREWDPTDPA
eukprot:gene11869-10263_t